METAKRPQGQRLASLKGWQNIRTQLSAEAVAEAYATENLDGYHLDVARRVLSLFATDPRAAKRLAGQVGVLEFDTPTQFLMWSQFKALLLKSSGGGSTLKSRKDAAWTAFLAAERACARTNKRLRFYARNPNRENPVYRVLLTRAKKYISEVLGELTPRTLEVLLSLSHPGSGCTIGTRRRDAVAPAFKYGYTDLVCTPKALPYARMLVEGSPVWVESAGLRQDDGTWNLAYKITDANRVSMVAKDATTERTIAVEPHLNVCLQLGVHEYLIRRLRGFGVDLRSQKHNQDAALRGSVDWESADPIVTLDLSAASDCVSQGLVERLLPPVWVDYLDCLRSPSYRAGKGEPVEYQKWSSMGNGYTFVLETLIFWGLARAVLSTCETEGFLRVYGDDIALPRGGALALIELLRYCGFKVNTEKSFVFGPFRESCGEDFFAGTRVVPTYLRAVRNLRFTDIYRLVNRFRDDERHRVTTLIARCMAAHRGYPVPLTLRNEDYSSGLFCDIAVLRSSGHVRWKVALQAYEGRRIVYRPYHVRHDPLWAYAVALRGARDVSSMEWELTKTATKRRGSWSLVRVIMG